MTPLTKLLIALAEFLSDLKGKDEKAFNDAIEKAKSSGGDTSDIERMLK